MKDEVRSARSGEHPRRWITRCDRVDSAPLRIVDMGMVLHDRTPALTLKTGKLKSQQAMMAAPGFAAHQRIPEAAGGWAALCRRHG